MPRGSGESKLQIAKGLHVAPGTVHNVLKEADFDEQILQSRSDCGNLLPQAIEGLKKAFAKGEGATCCRFLEGMNVLREHNVSRQPAISNGEKTGPGHCPEQQLIAQRPPMINQARGVF